MVGSVCLSMFVCLLRGGKCLFVYVCLSGTVELRGGKCFFVCLSASVELRGGKCLFVYVCLSVCLLLWSCVVRSVCLSMFVCLSVCYWHPFRLVHFLLPFDSGKNLGRNDCMLSTHLRNSVVRG